jgi:hypothetical protein
VAVRPNVVATSSRVNVDRVVFMGSRLVSV